MREQAAHVCETIAAADVADLRAERARHLYARTDAVRVAHRAHRAHAHPIAVVAVVEVQYAAIVHVQGPVVVHIAHGTVVTIIRLLGEGHVPIAEEEGHATHD